MAGLTQNATSLEEKEKYNWDGITGSWFSAHDAANIVSSGKAASRRSYTVTSRLQRIVSARLGCCCLRDCAINQAIDTTGALENSSLFGAGGDVLLPCIDLLRQGIRWLR